MGAASSDMNRWHPGLRFQIVLTLAAVLILGMVLLDFAFIRLTRVSLERQRTAGEISAREEENRPEPTLTVGQELSKLHNLTLVYMGSSIIMALLLGYIFLTMFIVKPASDLSRAAEKVAEGQLGVEVRVGGPAELTKLQRDFNQMSRRLGEQHRVLRERLAELEKSATDLREAQDRLIQSAKLASIGRLAAGVAHEIGNPLSAIRGFLELLGKVDPASREGTEYRTLALEEVERIHRVISELLAYSRTGTAGETGASLLSAAERAISLCRAQPLFDGVETEVTISPELGPLHATTDQLTQILVNLLLNAAAAMRGRGKVTLEGEVHPSWRRNPWATPAPAAVLRVTDTGPGIAPEHMDRIFEPFFTTKGSREGAGLGLAVCQSICERQEGDIRAENRPEGGARFTVIVPLEPKGKT